MVRQEQHEEVANRQNQRKIVIDGSHYLADTRK